MKILGFWHFWKCSNFEVFFWPSTLKTEIFFNKLIGSICAHRVLYLFSEESNGGWNQPPPPSGPCGTKKKCGPERVNNQCLTHTTINSFNAVAVEATVTTLPDNHTKESCKKATKALSPPPLELSGHNFFGKFYSRASKKFFLLAARPLPPP